MPESQTLKCLFCGAKLKNEPNIWDDPTDYYYCPRRQCKFHDQSVHREIWQALIAGKQAQDTLSEYKKATKDIPTMCGKIRCSLDAGAMDLAIHTVNQIRAKIESITNKGDK